jgi:5-formyltetrahydrofolate cyclo-ligase
VTREKEVIREKCKAVRLAMDREEVASKSRDICRKLLYETDRPAIKMVLVYRPIAKLNEVELDLFLENAKGLEIDELGAAPAQTLPAKKYDLIIAPTLAFDKDNYRLGWGGGFYDKLLAAQPQAKKIGVCFQNGFVEPGLPHEPHDIPLDKVITEV